MNIFDAFLLSPCTEAVFILKSNFCVQWLLAMAVITKGLDKLRQSTIFTRCCYSTNKTMQRRTSRHLSLSGIENVEPREIKMYCSRRKSLQQYHLLFKPIEHIFCVSVYSDEEAKKEKSIQSNNTNSSVQKQQREREKEENKYMR